MSIKHNNIYYYTVEEQKFGKLDSYWRSPVIYGTMAAAGVTCLSLIIALAITCVQLKDKRKNADLVQKDQPPRSKHTSRSSTPDVAATSNETVTVAAGKAKHQRAAHHPRLAK